MNNLNIIHTSGFIAFIVAVIIVVATYFYTSKRQIDRYDDNGTYKMLNDPNTYNDWYNKGTDSFGDPKADGCCLFPNKEVCKQYTPSDMARSCCGKGFLGLRPTTVNFEVVQDDFSECGSCRKKGTML